MQIMVKKQVSLEDMIIFGQAFYTKVLLFDLGEASLCSPCRATLEGSGWCVIILIFETIRQQIRVFCGYLAWHLIWQIHLKSPAVVQTLVKVNLYM